MLKIYERADDLHVRALCVYVKDSDEFAYVDKEGKTKASSDELHDAFIKGMIIIDGENNLEYKPVSCKVADGVTTVTYVTTDSSLATTAKLAVVKSETDPV